MVVVGDDSVNDYRNRNIVVAINSYDWGLFYTPKKVQTSKENTDF